MGCTIKYRSVGYLPVDMHLLSMYTLDAAEQKRQCKRKAEKRLIKDTEMKWGEGRRDREEGREGKIQGHRNRRGK